MRRKVVTGFDGKTLKGAIKHGGSGVMFWGCMSSKGVENLAFIKIIMDRKVYLNILKHNLKPSINEPGFGGDYISQ